ncbi:MAG: hypothetical protein E5Y69_16780 [Mesorhizobium sp.]|nr:MAG: hypothetical protein E5Y69_16780 [Mesorhizobium sp.]
MKGKRLASSPLRRHVAIIRGVMLLFGIGARALPWWGSEECGQAAPHGRLQRPAADEETIEKVEEAIARLSASLSEASGERASLQAERVEATEALQRSESQIIAANELLARYRLLDSRYSSDLQRLDFVTEGAHFFGGLQAVTCPLCEQPMTGDHAHPAASSISAVYESARIVSQGVV